MHSCLHCIYFACYAGHIQEHSRHKKHFLYVDLSYGHIYCGQCQDYIYDREMTEIGAAHRVKEAKSLGISVPYMQWLPNAHEAAALRRLRKRRLVSPHTTIGLRGLQNLGSTCFMNCIVQSHHAAAAVLINMTVLTLLLVTVANAIVNPQGPTVVSEFTNCLSSLIETNFEESGQLVFGNTNNMSTTVARIRDNLLAKIHESSKHSVQVMFPVDEMPICANDDEQLNVMHMDRYAVVPLGDYFIVLIDNFEDFTKVASKLIRSRNWNPHAKFIILFHPPSITHKDNIYIAEKIITCLFKHNVINVLVVVSDAQTIRNAIAYSWRPFDPPNYCGYFNETAKDRLFVENVCEQGVIKYKKDKFEVRLPRDMKGCTLYFIALKRQPFIGDNPDDPNIEKMLIDEVAKVYNFETHYKAVDVNRGERRVDGDWDGAFKKLTSKKGQLVVGGIFPDSEVHEDFECSITYLADSYTWVVPRAKQSPAWVSLIVTFKRFVWYCVIGNYFLCAVSWKIIGDLSKDTLYHRTLKHTFLNTWICTLGFCSYARPVKEGLRVFYVFFNLYCILFLTGYQTKLFDVLTNPSFEEQVDTIEELVVSGLKYGGFEELHDLFQNSSDPFDCMVSDNWVDIRNLTKALLDVVVYRNFSLLCSRLELAHMSAVIPELSDGSGNFRYFAFEQSMFTVPNEMVALRGFAYMEQFSLSLELLKQSGVSALLRETFADQNARKMAELHRSMSNDNPEVVPLSVLHLQGGFLALLMGYCGGTLVLVVEIILNNEIVMNKLAKCRTRFMKPPLFTAR